MQNQYRTIVVGIDGSDHSLVALNRAIAESESHGASLHVVYVGDQVTPAVLHLPGDVTVNTTDLAAAKRADVWSRSKSVMDTAPAETERVNLDGYPADSLIEYCAEIGADLLVVGTRSRGRLTSALLGSTALATIQRAGCDVLVARGR